VYRALIVDDNVELSENLVEILTDAFEGELEAKALRTAAEVLAWDLGDLDIALVDLHLPDAEGISLVEPLSKRAPHAQVVVITGDATVESAIAAMDHGAFGYVIKPFKPHDLVETARRAVERAGLLRAHAALQSELERSEERHRGVIESVPALVLALDSQDRIVIWNRRLEDLAGYPRDQMLGRPGRDLIGGEGGDRRLTTRHGRQLLVRWQLSQVPARSDPEPVTFAVGIDVTEEREAQRRAMRAERLAAVGTLAAGLAHEVRNPLNSASLQLQVLSRRLARGETARETLAEVVELVHSEIRRLDHLVSDFLAFARPNPMNLEPTPLGAIVNRVASLLRPECEVLGVSLDVDVASGLGLVQADEERMVQVLLNVVRNAIEATGPGGHLAIRTASADDRGDLTVTIEDDGPGFPEDAPIFDAFYTTKEQGTGLGLSIVHRIVAEHGGTILVESRPGATSFTLRLPGAVSA
jgi:signal transduction histidine kinase